MLVGLSIWHPSVFFLDITRISWSNKQAPAVCGPCARKIMKSGHVPVRSVASFDQKNHSDRKGFLFLS
jgi:hypothetical protein